MKSTVQRSWWRALTLFATLSILLAACGATDSGTASAPAASADTAPASAAASEPAEASEAGEASEAASEPAEASAAASEPAETSEAASSAAEPGASTAAGAGGVTLNADVSGQVDLWHFWGSPVRRNAIRRVIAICQQQLPNIQITETFKPFGDIYTAHLAAVAAGTGMADVIVEDLGQLPARAADGVDQNLQELAARDGITGDAFWPITWEKTQYEGNTYGVPFETDVRVLYYNKTAFKDAGLDPEKPPATWDELEQYADQLDIINGDTIERMGFSPMIGNGVPGIWGWTNGFVPVSEDGTITVNTPEHVETLEWVKSWIDRYGGWQNHQNFRANFASPPNDPFMSGKVAMHVDINGYSSQLIAFRPRITNAAGEQVEMEWGVAPVPYNKEQATASGGFALAVPSGSPNVEAAWEFIKCATGPEAQASWARDTYSMPARVEAASDPTLTADPNWQLFVDAMEYTKTNPFVPEYPNWEQELGNRYEQIWTGEVPIQQALDEAQQAIEAETGQ